MTSKAKTDGSGTVWVTTISVMNACCLGAVQAIENILELPKSERLVHLQMYAVNSCSPIGESTTMPGTALKLLLATAVLPALKFRLSEEFEYVRTGLPPPPRNPKVISTMPLETLVTCRFKASPEEKNE
jgi:hypothetical protein